jgi:signal transduction histidine kinase
MAKEKILLIDDSPIVCEVLKSLFEDEGYTVFTAENGRNGIEYTKSLKPDIVMIDTLLPDIDGFCVCREIRQFEISDSGPGIPEEYKQKIFDKFERITSEKQEGTGLGLPIAKDIIELHKGKMWVESNEGKGSTFIFALPKNN